MAAHDMQRLLARQREFSLAREKRTLSNSSPGHALLSAILADI
jgi:hypothetical protein